MTLIEPKTATTLSLDRADGAQGSSFSAKVLPASPYAPLIRTVEVTFKPTAVGAATTSWRSWWTGSWPRWS